MKSIAPLPVRARRVCSGLAAVVFLAGCGGPSSSSSLPAPRPIASDVERVQFDPSLGIRLDSMARRADGLYVQDLTVGTGSVAILGHTAVVRYTGWLTNGTKFDSGEISVSLGTNKTIRAWEEGLLGMRVGGRRRLVSPPALAYGSRDNGTIPPNSVLVFEMELISVY